MKSRKEKIEAVINMLKINDPELLSWISQDYDDGKTFERIIEVNLSAWGFDDETIENAILDAGWDTENQPQNEMEDKTMKTINEFKEDFKEELKFGDLIISNEISDATLFILRDGTIVDSLCDSFGCRLTTHSQVLINEEYDMNDLVTIEPESQTVILPSNLITWEQLESLEGIDEIYNDINVIGSQCNDTSIYLMQYLVDCGMDLKSALIILKEDRWAVIPDDELDDYTDEEQDDFLYLENGTFVDVW